MKTNKFFFIFCILVLFSSFVFSQTYSISGTQTKGSEGSNAKLLGASVKITHQVVIKNVEGENAGFWISTNGNVISKYVMSNDPSAIGFVLNPGIYNVYPNLKPNQQTATVTIKLE